MSDIVTVRDPDIIAAEINTVKEQVQKVLIYASIEIGGKLTEAKGLVPQGEWGRWLEKNVEYSQSTAENMMKLYREYGGNQESLFDTWTKSETFGKLTYTQHLALLALPFSDRQEFAEQNNVEDMSTRQLLKAVQDELEQERREHEQTKEDRELAEARARDAEQSVIDMQQRLSAAKSSEDAWQKEIDKLNDARKKAEQAEANTKKTVEDLQKQLKESHDREETIRAEIKRIREEPDIPATIMEQLRKEAEAEAAEKATEDIRKKLETAEAALKAAEQGKQAAEAELVAAQKKLKMADRDIMEYETLAQKLISDYNVLNGLRKKITVHDREAGEKLKQFQTKMVAMMADALEITK